ncbi:MAG: cbb3-type cytochrome c oxidase subunit 3 [Thiobacillus sp.]|nr:cbb3-type cytochrome c oxidase subunit 3 [Thiobacillus sp.]
MDSGTISGIVTVVFIVVFIGIVWWAYSKGNKQRFEDAGKLPFDEEGKDKPAKQGDKQ